MSMAPIAVAGSLFFLALFFLAIIRWMYGRARWEEIAKDEGHLLPLLSVLCMCAGTVILAAHALTKGGLTEEVLIKSILVFIGVIVVGMIVSGATMVFGSIQQRFRVGA